MLFGACIQSVPQIAHNLWLWCAQVDAIEDKTQALLNDVAAGKEVNKPDAENLKKRKLVKPE